MPPVRVSSGSSPPHNLHWQHFRGDGTRPGPQEVYDPGRSAEVTWLLPGEAREGL
jgi:hypothetical protein